MIWRIIRFEFLDRFKQAFTYLFIVMGIFQGAFFSVGMYDGYSNAGTLRNAASIIYRGHAGMGMLVFIISTIIAASSLTKDLNFRTGEIMYSSIVNEKKFFLGRFLSAFFLNIVITTSFSIGMLSLKFIGFGSPNEYTATPVGQTIHAFIVLTIPNLFLITALSFGLIVFFKKSTAAYAGAILVLIMFMVAELLYKESIYKSILILFDPLAYCATSDIMDSLNIVERNVSYLKFNALLSWNRAIWLIVSSVSFIAAYVKFSFKDFICPRVKKSKEHQSTQQITFEDFKIKKYKRVFSTFEMIKKSFRFAKIEFLTVVRPVSFKITMFLLYIMFLGYTFFWSEKYFLTTAHLPLTSYMTWPRVPLTVYLVMIVMIFGVELLFKDRKVGAWSIIDASPTPTWVLITAKFLAISLVSLIIVFMIFSAGVIAQIAQGFTDIEFALYAKDLLQLRFGWLTYVFTICLAFFFATLFNSRFFGHIVGVGVFIFTLICLDMGLIENLLNAFPLVPGIDDYSAINGYGVFDKGLWLYTLYWALISFVIFLLTIIFWNRGTKTTFKERLIKGFKKLNFKFGIVLLILFISLIYTRNIISYNVNVLGGHQFKDDKSKEAAMYEKKFSQYKEQQRFKITALKMKLNLFPKKRMADYIANIVVENKGDIAVNTLHISLKKFLKLNKFSLNGIDLELLEEDKLLRYRIYKLPSSINPDEKINLYVEGEMAYKGFNQSDPQGDLTFNGTFMGSDILPHFGYDDDREEEENKQRLKFGIDKLESRMDETENKFSKQNLFSSNQSDGLNLDMVVVTSSDQSIVTAGELIESKTENNRNYFHYVSKKVEMDFKIISARYDIKEFNFNNITVKIYYDKKHYYNIEYFEEITKEALTWLSQKLGEYPYKELKIVEKTLYDDDFYTFNNVIAISEKHGWSADINDKKGKGYIYRVLLRELAKQYISGQLHIANVQGADIFTMAIPDYFSLTFMKEVEDNNNIIKWLKQSEENYIDGKYDEEIVERDLLHSDDTEYLGRDKGGLAFHAIAVRVGVDKFNNWIKEWILNHSKSKNKKFLISYDLYDDLKDQFSSVLGQSLVEWFENRTVNSFALKKVKYSKGKVDMAIATESWFEEGLGDKKSNSRDFKLEVGTISNGKVNILGIINVSPGVKNYSLNVSQSHRNIIIDPNFWYLDVSRGDNQKDIE